MADFIGTDADEILDGTEISDRFFGGNGGDTLRGRGGDDLLVGGGGADTGVFETGRSSFVVTSPFPDVLVVSEGPGLSAGNGIDILAEMEAVAFGTNLLSAAEALRVFAPAPGAEPVALAPETERLLADYEATGSWSPALEAPGSAAGDGLQAIHDSGLSWDEIAARVLANFEATGDWYF